MANTFNTSKIPMMSLKFDNTYAINSTQKWKTLIIGYQNKDSKTPLNKTFLVSSAKEGEDLFGKGSLLEEQITAYKQNDLNIETWAIAIEEPDTTADPTKVPNLQDVFDTIKDNRYNAFVCPFSDEANLKILSDRLRERWEPTLQNDGFAFVFINKPLKEAADYCNKELNSQNIAMINTFNFPDAGHKINAALAAQCCAVALSDPALPLTTMILSGITAPDEENQFSWQERSNLLDAGISTIKIIGSDVVVERVITTYKTTNGVPDESYLNAETVFTLSYIREYFRNRFWGKYGQFKLADDGAMIAPGQRILTPKTAKAELISIYKELEDMGYVENGDLFIKNLSVERDKINRSMIHMVIPPTVIGQLFQVQALIQFRK